MCALALFFATSSQADNMYRTDPATVTVFTDALPQGFSTDTQLPGLSVLEIDHLSALSADLVQIQLGEDHGPMSAVRILNTTYPNATFELFEDFEIEEASADLTFE